MHRLLSLLALVLLAGPAVAGPTKIAQLPLLNITGTGAVQPNLMLLFDNSGSMASTFTPDYVDDSVTCRARALMSSATRGCSVGHPPFNSADFNKQYYNPAVTYAPPVRMTTFYRARTSRHHRLDHRHHRRLQGQRHRPARQWRCQHQPDRGFPDLKWCEPGTTSCMTNSATYAYPNDAMYEPKPISANPYYYTIGVAEYCTDATMVTCKNVPVGGAAPAGYPVPAKVRWCDSTALTKCQAKYVGNFKYPRYSSPNSGQLASYGTITIGAWAAMRSASTASRWGTRRGGDHQRPSHRTGGTDTGKAAAIHLGGRVDHRQDPGQPAPPACARRRRPAWCPLYTLGITLGTDSMVAVVPITCPPAAGTKSVGPCTVMNDASRGDWPITVARSASQVYPAQQSTALYSFTGKLSSKGTPHLASLMLGSQNLLTAAGVAFATSLDGPAVAAALVNAIVAANMNTGFTAYLGGTKVSSACTAACRAPCAWSTPTLRRPPPSRSALEQRVRWTQPDPATAYPAARTRFRSRRAGSVAAAPCSCAPTSSPRSTATRKAPSATTVPAPPAATPRR
jgi:type IV pilus assembly protein PilY1